jgi:hypothetical protein
MSQCHLGHTAERLDAKAGLLAEIKQLEEQLGKMKHPPDVGSYSGFAL